MNGFIDNSSLLPQILPDEQVTLDSNGTPNWANGLIFAQIRIATATKEGTLAAARKVIDHYAEMGVNALWVAPIYEPGKGGNGYSNLGPHTVDPAITGTDDYEQGLQEVARFVEYAHSKRVRILLDLISWGTVKGSKMREEHPDWYTGLDEWGGDAFDWSNEEFKNWYIKVAVNIIHVTKCDGFRYDVEPRYAGYKVDKEIRDRLYDLGHKTFMMSESGNERMGTYDCEQIGITNSIPGFFEEKPVWYFLDRFNLVDSIKLGVNIGSGLWKNKNVGCMHRYYINTLTCHDHRYPVICGNRLAVGYQAIFAPFIPQWYIGEEWNNPLNIIPGEGGRVLYFNEINWESLEEQNNREFYEDFKRMIRVRRENPDVFEYYPEHFKDTNICKVSSNGNLQAYARFSKEKVFVVIPNNSEKAITVDACVPLQQLGFSLSNDFILYDAFNNDIISRGSGDAIADIHVEVEPNNFRLLKLQVV